MNMRLAKDLLILYGKVLKAGLVMQCGRILID